MLLSNNYDLLIFLNGKQPVRSFLYFSLVVISHCEKNLPIVVCLGVRPPRRLAVCRLWNFFFCDSLILSSRFFYKEDYI